MAEPDLTALAFAAGRDDRAAAADLILHTQHDVARSLRRLSNPADMEDLTQETYLRAWRALPEFAGRSSVRPGCCPSPAGPPPTTFDAPPAAHVSAESRTGQPDTIDQYGRSRFDEDHALLDLLSKSCRPNGAMRSSPPGFSACPMPKPPRYATARSVHIAPVWPVPGRTSSPPCTTSRPRRDHHRRPTTDPQTRRRLL